MKHTMGRPDRIVALLILAFSLGYAVLAVNYELLPFEQHLDFRPNTMPIGLAVLGVIFSLGVIIAPGGDPSGMAKDADGWRQFDWPRTAGIVTLMIAYALLLRPLGYVVSTTAFLTIGGVLLGERRLVVLVSIALTGALSTWYLVDRVLGIYMKPWPMFGS